MNGDLFLVLALLWPLLSGLSVLFLPVFAQRKTRNGFVGFALLLQCALVAAAVCFPSRETLTVFTITRELPIVLAADGLGRFFAVLVTFMWTLAGFYAFDYMKHEERESRFFGCFLLTLFALTGLCFSQSLVTFYLFYEAMTFLSMPLVFHTQTREAIAAGMKYLFFSIFGAMMGLLGIFYFAFAADSALFAAGGVLSGAPSAVTLGLAFVMIVGFGVKAGMFPMHAWLPTAHPVAPSPASAVLSGVITKMGVLGIIRVIFYVVGADNLRGTWVQTAFAVLTLITVFMGSMLAYRTDLLKKRLAYSTVSQVSYVLFGLSTLTPVGFVGALLHIVFHSIIKDALFMEAGAIIEHSGKKYVSELRGIGKQMPVTIWCFALCALGLIGIPPTGGFVSKWSLALGALGSNLSGMSIVGPAVLLVSALLTAGYLMPVVINGFLPGEDFDYASSPKCEANALMLTPIVILSALCVLGGMFPGVLQAMFETLAGYVM